MQRRTDDHLRQNVALARTWIGKLGRRNYQALCSLSQDYGFSIALGDLLLLDEKWYVTHTGLIRLANRARCWGIRVQPMREFCDASASRWVFRATVYKSPRSRGFVGFGDADPSNTSSLVHGAEMRVAETRAVNRALRKAYGIGLCSVEELGWTPRATDSGSFDRKPPVNGTNGHQNGQPRLRDRLCLLIRQYRLDASLVKAYAADFCNTSSLREASKEQVQAFIDELARRAAGDLPGLICQLNSYAKPQETQP